MTASATENADLFWGARGGGGDFGIVTNFEFRLHPLGPDIFAGPVFWPMEHAAKVLRFYRDWVADCPDELMTIVVQRRVLDLPGVPRDLVGRHVIAVTACYAGPVEDGERVLRPLKSFGRPLLVTSASPPERPRPAAQLGDRDQCALQLVLEGNPTARTVTRMTRSPQPREPHLVPGHVNQGTDANPPMQVWAAKETCRPVPLPRGQQVLGGRDVGWQ